jgi:hypothetical protein
MARVTHCGIYSYSGYDTWLKQFILSTTHEAVINPARCNTISAAVQDSAKSGSSHSTDYLMKKN